MWNIYLSKQITYSFKFNKQKLAIDMRIASLLERRNTIASAILPIWLANISGCSMKTKFYLQQYHQYFICFFLIKTHFKELFISFIKVVVNSLISNSFDLKTLHQVWNVFLYLHMSSASLFSTKWNCDIAGISMEI